MARKPFANSRRSAREIRTIGVAAFRAVLISGLCVGLVACRVPGLSGALESSRDDYLDATTNKKLELPSDMDAEIVDPLPIPEIQDHPLAQVFPKDAPRPTALVQRDDEEAVRLQRLGARQWMIVGDEPELVWPVVMQFFADSSVAVVEENAEEGLVVGEWFDVENRDYPDVLRAVVREKREPLADFSGGNRLRIRLEQGIRHGSTEIHLRHDRRDPAVASTDFDTASAIPEIEAELLAELGAFYAAGYADVSVSLMGSTVAALPKAVVERDVNGYPILRLMIDFDRTWATVGQALERAEVEVLDVDRETATFRARVRDGFIVSEEPGFFGRLNPFRRSGSSGDPAVRIRISEIDGGHVVRCVDDADNPVDVELSERVLATVRAFAT